MTGTIILLAAAGVFAVIFYLRRRISKGGGCCGGEHDPAAPKIRAADRDLSHYPYIYTVGIEGMVCSHCVRNVENAFNSAEGICAFADLGKKSAKVYSKQILDRRKAASLLDGTDYTLTEITEERS